MKNLVIVCSIVLLLSCRNEGGNIDVNTSKISNYSLQDVFSSPEAFGGIDTLIDWNYVHNEIRNDIDIPEEDLNERLSLFKKGITTNLPSFSTKESTDFLYRQAGAYSLSNKFHILIEVASDNGIDLFDLEVDTVNNLVKDIYVYSTGQSLIGIFKSQIALPTSQLQPYIGLYESAKKSYDIGEYETAWEYIDMMPYELRYKFPVSNLVYRLSEYEYQLIIDLIDEYQDVGFYDDYIAFISLKAGVLHEKPEMITKNTSQLAKKFSNSVLLKSYIGYAYELEGNFKEAENHYNQVLTMFPEHIWGYLDMIELLILKGENAKALELMKKCDEKFKTNREYWENLFDEPEILEKYKRDL